MYTANTPAPTVVVYQVHILRYRICISSGTAVYNQYERRRASDGGRAMYVHRNTAYVPGAALLLLLSAFVCRFFLSNRGRAALGRFGPGSRRGCVGMGTDKGKPALSRRADPRSSRHERKRLGEPLLLYVHTANASAAV